MKKEYTNPIFDVIKINLQDSVLTNSDGFSPEEGIREDIVDDNP